MGLFGSIGAGLGLMTGGVGGMFTGGAAGTAADRFGGRGGSPGSPGGYKRPTTEDPRVAAMRARMAGIRTAAGPAKPLAMEQRGQDPYFAQARQAAGNRVNAQGMSANNALNRRLAAMGQTNSGSALKNQQLLQDQLAQQHEQAQLGIGGQEMQANQAVDQRNFQREGMNAEDQFRRMQAELAGEGQLGALDAQYAGADAEQSDNAYNRWMNEQQMKRSGGLFGGGGFLGLGF